ncbi:Glutamine-dependent NAD(+) synthetase [Gimesia panareensis]|uniref:Glutamine-dependent NAD(+) synthetase n=1 Tax=Gimesia panareensis TaxID=2527978 RepID=A0A518FHK9_9PLAN|nr:NAD+ synthase [Gimesia panareensis]QDV15836.1 Glutamine-dependent NAD(+) synthetase [Gimesia panareensis]
MKIALAQLNPTVGDLHGNCQRILEAVQRAEQAGADLVLFSELVVCGYPPKDILLREGFIQACDQAVEQLAREIPAGIGVIVGHPTGRDLPEGRMANAASLLYQGAVQACVHKLLLPNYDVFDEQRYFRHADQEQIRPVEFGGLKLGLHICEDAWWGQPDTFYHNQPAQLPDPVRILVEAGSELLINISASPFEIDKRKRRQQIIQTHVDRYSVPYLFVNQVGGNDDLVFDGHSFVLDQNSRLRLQLSGFEEDLQLFDTSTLEADTSLTVSPLSREEQLFDALVLGLRDYMQKCGFTDCVLGLSGGIDSALASAVAAEAIGPEHVHALLLPSRYSSEHSVADSLELAQNLGIDYETVPIDTVHQAFENLPVIGDDLREAPAGLADQNLQARIRGANVMVRSNQHGWMALATGNKSELAMGYCTLYGDMAGGFAVLCDVLKCDVYLVSRYVNQRAGRTIIPENILDKAPSAELAPNQVDQDSLPPYELLDGILKGLIEDERSVRSLSEQYPRETVQWVANRLDRNEFKRRQMPPGIKLSARAFGSGRRMPMAARFHWDEE